MLVEILFSIILSGFGNDNIASGEDSNTLSGGLDTDVFLHGSGYSNNRWLGHALN